MSHFGVRQDTFAVEPEALSLFLEGAYHLLGRAAGEGGDLEVGEYVRGPFIDTFGEGAVRRSAYNFAVDHIDHTEWFEGEDSVMAYEFETATVHTSWDVLLEPVWAGSMILHEAAHGYFEEEHVLCEDGELLCDEGWCSANGLQAGIADLWHTHLNEEDPSNFIWERNTEQTAGRAAHRVLAP